jgi:hypothetical protein
VDVERIGKVAISQLAGRDQPQSFRASALKTQKMIQGIAVAV